MATTNKLTPTSLSISSQSDPELQKLLAGVWGETPSKVPLLALYFASSWCDDCQASRGPVRKLFELQSQQEPKNRLFDLVYVSSDYTEEEMMSNLETGWIYVPFENVQQRNDLKRHFGICAKKEMEDVGISEDHRKNGIPTLIIIDKQRDVVLTAQGIDDIMGSETTTKVDDPLSKWRHLLSLSNLED